MKKLLAICILLYISCASYGANSIRQIYSFEDMQTYFPAQYVYGAVTTGGQTYCQLFGTYVSGLTSVSRSSDGVLSNDTLIDPEYWNVFSKGKERMNSYNSMSTDGRYLYYIEMSTDQILRTDTYDGSTSVFAYASDIAAATGNTSAILVSYGDEYNSEYYFFDASSRSVVKAAGSGVDVYLSKTELESLTSYDGFSGSSSVAGGITFDDSGKMYWGCNSNHSIYSWDGTDCEVVISESDISAITGQDVLSLGDIFVAPDGNMYFMDNGFGILKYIFPDIDNTKGAVEVILTVEELLDLGLDTQYVFCFDWCDDSLAFIEKTSGYYEVVTPEPMAMTMISLGAMLVARRKRQ